MDIEDVQLIVIQAMFPFGNIDVPFWKVKKTGKSKKYISYFILYILYINRK